MGKRNVMITVDEAVLQEVKAKGLNVSGLCESHLREVNHSFTASADPVNCKHKFTWPFSTPRGLTKECTKCGLFRNIQIESYEETMKA